MTEIAKKTIIELLKSQILYEKVNSYNFNSNNDFNESGAEGVDA